MRCLYGQTILNVLKDGYTVINIDQTWLSQADFRYFKWCAKGESNSLPVKGMSPRISMIAAISTTGKLYVSLTQVNTDSDMIMLFIGYLVRTLVREDPDYRKKTVFLLDGAAYHKSRETRSYFDHLGLKLMISAAYSYQAASCELFFALFKQTNINIDELPTGKT